MDTTAAVSQGMKDRFEIASKSVAIAGGILSAIALIYTLNATTLQRKSELRWNQAQLAMSFTDAMLDDAAAFDALRMVDWDKRSYAIGGGMQDTISSDDVRRALDIRSNNSLSPTDVYVREAYDRLFYHLGKIERAVDSHLVLLEDVTSPIDYYTPHLMNRYGDVLVPYMRQLGDCDAMNLLNRFDPAHVPTCSSPAARTPPRD